MVLDEIIDLAKREKKKRMLLNVDFEKACDNVNWGFMKYMLCMIGFVRNG